MKVKIFEAASGGELTYEFSSWLRENPNVRVMNVTNQTVSLSSWGRSAGCSRPQHTLTVIYEGELAPCITWLQPREID